MSGPRPHPMLLNLAWIVALFFAETKSLIHFKTLGVVNSVNESVSYNHGSIDTWKMASLISSADSMGTFLQDLINHELGVNETKRFFSVTSFETKRRPGIEDLTKILGNNFSAQLSTYVDAVERLAESVQILSLSNDTILLPKCCELDPIFGPYDGEYKTEVRKNMACWHAVSKSKTNFLVPALFSQVMIKNSIKEPSLRWQYFVSPEGIYVEYPANLENCHSNSPTFDGARSNFIRKSHPERKIWLMQKPKQDSRIHRLVLVVELGQRPGHETIIAMKDIIRRLLRLMDESTEVGVLTVDSDEDDLSSDFVCGQTIPVTPWTRTQILSYLDDLEQKFQMANTNGQEEYFEQQEFDHLLALNRSLQLACANFSAQPLFPPSAVTIVHILNEIPSNKSTAAFPINSPCPVFIESYFLGNVGNDVEMSYKARLQRSSSKNIWSIQVHSANQMRPEEFATKVASKLNSKKELWSLSDILSQFFPEGSKNSSVEFSVPHWNPVSKEPVIVAKKYVMYNGAAMGLVAVEIPVKHFTQQISYYVNENQCDATNYAFLIDINGRVISHPALGKPDATYEALSPIQIEQVEIRHGFKSLLKKILVDEPSGCHSLQKSNQKDWITYAWYRVQQNYIVVLVALDDNAGCFPYGEDMVFKKSRLSPKADVQHHLLLEQEQCCGREAINVNKASLHLSPSAFSNPSTIFSSRNSIKLSMAVMAFLSDSSGLLRNQNKGLKSSVKSSIGIISNFLPIWKLQSQTSIWKKYIQRRFAAAAGGTCLLVYPGITMASDYTPHSSSWFRNTVNGNGKLMFSPPKINVGGIPTSSITTAVTINGAAREIPVAILGATVSIGFFQKLLGDMVPDCAFRKSDDTKTKKLEIRCILLDQNGFIIYHHRLANFLQTTSTVTVHLTQIEPLCAIDILQGGTNSSVPPLRKETCHKLSATSATQGSLQRFYTFSLPSGGIQKVNPGETCYQYQIVPIPGTNLFLAKIQDSCTSVTAFCPCSTVNNLCLNCLRVEMNDCECPCECPQAPKPCGKKTPMDLLPNVEPCEFPEDPVLFQGTHCANESLPCDWLTQCSEIMDEKNCVGVHDCTWCDLGSRLQCLTFEQCYGFLRGSKGQFLYDSLQPIHSTDVTLDEGRQSSESQITIVPILAILAVFLIFLALVFFCYRHRALGSGFSQPDVSLLPLQESPMGSVIPQAGSTPNSDSDSDMSPVPAVYIRRQLRREVNQAAQPPRSPHGSVFTESDNGYSTMTQNEDASEASVRTQPVVYSSGTKQIPERFTTQRPQDTYTSTRHDTVPAANTNVVGSVQG